MEHVSQASIVRLPELAVAVQQLGQLGPAHVGEVRAQRRHADAGADVAEPVERRLLLLGPGVRRRPAQRQRRRGLAFTQVLLQLRPLRHHLVQIGVSVLGGRHRASPVVFPRRA